MHMKEAMLTLQKGHYCLMEMSYDAQHSSSQTMRTPQTSKISLKKDIDDHHKVTKFLSSKVYHLLLPFFLKIIAILRPKNQGEYVS